MLGSGDSGTGLTTTDYDAGDTTGLGGDMGDDAVHEDNQAQYQYADVDASSVVGLTNDGTIVVEENAPADVEEETMPGSGMTVDEFVDSATTEDGNSPGGNGTGAMEANTQGAVTNWVADTSVGAYDWAADTTGDVVDDATDAALPDWMNWILDNPMLVGGGAAVVAAAVLFRPYAGLADSAT